MTEIDGALSEEQARAFAARWLPAWTGNEPERLLAFYATDAVYSDPHVPDGIRGHSALLVYFRQLLMRFPDWEWQQHRATPMLGGFLNHWQATIPVPGTTITCRGVCTVQLADGLIARNEVYFDRSNLLAALPRPRR